MSIYIPSWMRWASLSGIGRTVELNMVQARTLNMVQARTLNMVQACTLNMVQARPQLREIALVSIGVTVAKECSLLVLGLQL